MFVFGGGGILYDGDADMYLQEVRFAPSVETPVMVYAISAGPLVDPGVRARVRDALNQAAVVTVRDRSSRQLLEYVIGGRIRDVELIGHLRAAPRPHRITLQQHEHFEMFDAR